MLYVQWIEGDRSSKRRLVDEKWLCIACEADLRHVNDDGTLEDHCTGCLAEVRAEIERENLIDTVCTDVTTLTHPLGAAVAYDPLVDAVGRLLGLVVSEDLSADEKKAIVTTVAERCGLIG